MRYLQKFEQLNHSDLVNSKIIRFKSNHKLFEQIDDSQIKDMNPNQTPTATDFKNADKSKPFYIRYSDYTQNGVLKSGVIWRFDWEKNQKTGVEEWVYKGEVSEGEKEDLGIVSVAPEVTDFLGIVNRVEDLPKDAKDGDAWMVKRYDADGSETGNGTPYVRKGNSWIRGKGLWNLEEITIKGEKGETWIEKKVPDWGFLNYAEDAVDATADFLNKDWLHTWIDGASFGADVVGTFYKPAAGLATAIDLVHSLQWLHLWKGTKRDGSRFFKNEEEEEAYKWNFWLTLGCTLIPGAVAQLLGNRLKTAIKNRTLIGELLLEAKRFIYDNLGKVIEGMRGVIETIQKYKATKWMVSDDLLNWSGRKLDELAAEAEEMFARKARAKGDIPSEIPDPRTTSGKTLELIPSPSPTKQKSGIDLRGEARKQRRMRAPGKVSTDFMTPNLQELISRLPKNWVDADYLKPLIEGTAGMSQAIIKRLGFKSGGEYMLILKDNTGKWIGQSVTLVDDLSEEVIAKAGQWVFNPLTRQVEKALADIPGVKVRMKAWVPDAAGNLTEQTMEMVISYKDFVKHGFTEALRYGKTRLRDSTFLRLPRWILKLYNFLTDEDEKNQVKTGEVDKDGNPIDNTQTQGDSTLTSEQRKEVRDSREAAQDSIHNKLAETLPEDNRNVQADPNAEYKPDDKNEPLINKEDVGETDDANTLKSDIEKSKESAEKQEQSPKEKPKEKVTSAPKSGEDGGTRTKGKSIFWQNPDFLKRLNKKGKKSPPPSPPPPSPQKNNDSEYNEM
jgi:hypothetical protein